MQITMFRWIVFPAVVMVAKVLYGKVVSAFGGPSRSWIWYRKEHHKRLAPTSQQASDNGTLPIHKGGWASQSLARIGSRYTLLSCHEEEEDEEQV